MTTKSDALKTNTGVVGLLERGDHCDDGALRTAAVPVGAPERVIALVEDIGVGISDPDSTIELASAMQYTHERQAAPAPSPRIWVGRRPRAAGIGRTTPYAAIVSGKLRSNKIGRRRVITVDALREWIAANEE